MKKRNEKEDDVVVDDVVQDQPAELPQGKTLK